MSEFVDKKTEHESTAVAASIPETGPNNLKSPEKVAPQPESAATTPATITEDILHQLKAQITRDVLQEIKQEVTQEIVSDIIQTLSQKFLKKDRVISESVPAPKPVGIKVEPKPVIPTAAERLGQISAFKISKETCETPIWTVKLGATRAEGGTRGQTYLVGGETCMPFHHWEGEMPNRPLIAMEVFDVVSEKYPLVLRQIYGDLLQRPAEMARRCVEEYGADLISVRLEGTHPEKGNRTADQSVALIQSILAAVPVPLIITGHSHFDKHNEVLKAVAQACAGENLLLNWVEQNNYRTIAGAAMAYGHSVVAQSPIDVNIAKQMNILLTNMDLKSSQIVMDPLTGATGYGIEYTYSVMERIRLTALNGDKMLAGPMIVSPGQECMKIKEFRAREADFPAWGEITQRAALWELTTAVNLLYAGADILILYHPTAVAALKKTIHQLIMG
ncbi:acetyl-CoA decarbonylase/synthase complex subunit delta [candidate division KSB1 bacterium]|nr:acetyl-CoA decarbonylase/synthase complex subunit delta [candidate division KSB1 bacterium]